MKNIIYLSVSLVIYLAGIILLLVKLKHIIDNPERYDEPSLVAEADAVEAHKTHLNIFKSLSHQYSFVGFILTLVITALDFGILMLAQKLLIGANEQIFLGTTLIGVIALFFLNIIVGMAVIPLMIKTPFFEISARDTFNSDSRRRTYKKTYIAVLAMFVLTVPFAIFSTNNYCYYNADGIGWSDYWELTEYYVGYEDIDSVSIYAHHSNNGNFDTFCYEISAGGRTINVNTPNMGIKYITEDAFAIHNYIEKSGGCETTIVPLNDVDRQHISELTERQQYIIDYIFEGFHL